MNLDRLALLLVALPLTGCVQEWAVSMNPPDEFLALCEEHNGLKIYRTAENVEGVIYSREHGCGLLCRGTMIDRRYEFVEAEATIKSYGDFVPGPGTYRFTAEELGHPNCAIFETWHDAKLRALRSPLTRMEPYKEFCIATWPIERLTTPYEVRYLGIITRDRWYGVLRTRTEQVIDRRDGTVMAEHRTHWIDTPNLPGGMSCPGDQPGWSIYSILKPAERQ